MYNVSNFTVGEDYELLRETVKLIPGSNEGNGRVRLMIPNDYMLEDDEEFVINVELQPDSSALLDISSTIIVIMGDQGMY